MGRGAEQRSRPVPCAFAAGPMESRDGISEAVRVAAHLVERDQSIEDIEGGVLGALGHHRPARLLEPGDELQALLVFARFEQYLADEIENRWIGARVAPLRYLHRAQNGRFVLG